MLRIVVLVLALANAAYFAWAQGLFGGLGLAPAPSSEPQRLQQQIKPEVVRILPASEAMAAEVARLAAAPAECLLAGPLDAAQIAAMRQALEAWPKGSWSFEAVASPNGAQQLKLAAVDDAMRPRIDALRPVLNAVKLRPCR